jgi:hypothetical protein
MMDRPDVSVGLDVHRRSIVVAELCSILVDEAAGGVSSVMFEVTF